MYIYRCIYISGINEVSSNFISLKDISKIEFIQVLSGSLIYVMNF